MRQPNDKNNPQEEKKVQVDDEDRSQNDREKFSPGEPDDYDAEEFSTD